MKYFMNAKISTKLICGFLVVAFIAIIIGGVGIINMMNIEKAGTELYEQNAMGLKYSGNAATTFQMIRYNTLRLITYKTTTEISDSKLYISDLYNELETLFIDLDNVLFSTESRSHFDIIKKEWVNYKEFSSELIGFVEDSNSEMALQVLEEQLAPVGTIIRDNLISMMDVVSTNAELKAERNTQLATTSILIMASAGVFGLVISIILGLYISHIVGTPLKLMAEGAEKLALGDVDIDLDTTVREDEVGKLTQAFIKVIDGRKTQVAEVQRMAEGDLTVTIHAQSNKDVLNNSLSHLVSSLNELVISIINASEQVASGAGLVSDSSMTLSQGATEQASSVEQLTASLEEIASQTTINAKNAQLANDSAKHVKDNAEVGNAQMHQMLKAMDEINQSSGSIGKIIKVIDDIAFQTNILALNAAVEAARAGQHGKGFAVVAEEVRTLAARSAQAAKETTDLIEGSIKKVDTGTKIANETAEALGKIVNEVAITAELIDSIAIASKEQASAIEQINQGIMQVSTVVQNNAATSQESAAASEELSTQASQLREIVGMFRVKDNDNQNISTLNIQKDLKKTKKIPAFNNLKSSISISENSYGKY